MRPRTRPPVLAGLIAVALALSGCGSGEAEGGGTVSGGEASLALPDLGSVTVMGGVSGRLLLMVGLLVCGLGLAFGGDRVRPAAATARASLDARGVRADLRDVQGLSHQAGPIPAAAVGASSRR